MSKRALQASSHTSRQAVELLGHLIRATRIERRMTVSEVAERAGISRGLMHRIERGDMGCSIGAVFEVAAIVGVALFDAQPKSVARELGFLRDKLAVLPAAVRQRPKDVQDDF